MREGCRLTRACKGRSGPAFRNFSGWACSPLKRLVRRLDPAMFSIRRPTARSIAAFIDAQSESPLSYAPIGLSRKAYDGYNHDVLRQRVGCGERAFAAARAALETWRAFPRGWIEVFPADAPVTPDTTVAVLAHHLGFWSLNACRVVERLGGSGSEFGFAYGTLTQHAESGEERFVVSLDPRDETSGTRSGPLPSHGRSLLGSGILSRGTFRNASDRSPLLHCARRLGAASNDALQLTKGRNLQKRPLAADRRSFRRPSGLALRKISSL